MRLRFNPELQLPPKPVAKVFNADTFSKELERFLEEIESESKALNTQHPVNEEENKSALLKIESWFV